MINQFALYLLARAVVIRQTSLFRKAHYEYQASSKMVRDLSSRRSSAKTSSSSVGWEQSWFQPAFGDYPKEYRQIECTIQTQTYKFSAQPRLAHFWHGIKCCPYVQVADACSCRLDEIWKAENLVAHLKRDSMIWTQENEERQQASMVKCRFHNRLYLGLSPYMRWNSSFCSS